MGSATRRTWIGSFVVSGHAGFNCDGFVDGIDYDSFVAHFETGC